MLFIYMRPLPRDTSVSRQIIIVCCESVGNCQTLSKDGRIFKTASFLCIVDLTHLKMQSKRKSIEK